MTDNSMDGTDRSRYQRWLDSDPLLPGVTYVIVFSGGVLGGAFVPGLVTVLVGFYILIAFGVNIGANIQVRKQETETDYE